MILFSLLFRREETLPKRLRHPEKKPVQKNQRPVQQDGKHKKSPLKPLVKHQQLDLVDEFSAPAAPIHQQAKVGKFPGSLRF